MKIAAFLTRLANSEDGTDHVKQHCTIWESVTLLRESWNTGSSYVFVYVFANNFLAPIQSPIVTKFRQSYPRPQGTRWLNFVRSKVEVGGGGMRSTERLSSYICCGRVRCQLVQSCLAALRLAEFGAVCESFIVKVWFGVLVLRRPVTVTCGRSGYYHSTRSQRCWEHLTRRWLVLLAAGDVPVFNASRHG